MKKIFFTLIILIVCLLCAIGAAEIHFYLKNKTIYASYNLKNLDHFRYPLNLSLSSPDIALGGSTTFGLGLEDGEDWPTLLSKELHRPIANLGRLGAHLQEFRWNATSWQKKRYLAEDLYFTNWSSAPQGEGQGWLALKPTRLFLAPPINDTAPWLYYSVLSRSHPHLYWGVRFLNSFPFGDKLALIHDFKKMFLKMMERGVHPEFLNDEDLNFVKGRLKNELIQLLEICKREKIQVFLIRFPILFGQFPEANEDILLAQNQKIYSDIFKMRFIFEQSVRIEQQVFEELARNYQIQYICAACRLDKLPLKERLNYFVDPIHLNASGQQIIAQDILLSLKQEKKL